MIVEENAEWDDPVAPDAPGEEVGLTGQGPGFIHGQGIRVAYAQNGPLRSGQRILSSRRESPLQGRRDCSNIGLRIVIPQPPAKLQQVSQRAAPGVVDGSHKRVFMSYELPLVLVQVPVVFGAQRLGAGVGNLSWATSRMASPFSKLTEITLPSRSPTARRQSPQ